ncbi:class I SAM-dependent methyltransferase [Pseudomonas sp. GD03842]|uniref:class I SAM-dependent methyltransferase n=1 Tax=unclassified Pseudomonas TaxID=196821 RepID=UPI000D344369|nr:MULTISPECIES: class I SAM-dependent methyltransferase [unclassified Pseudomonas]MDH0746121.1 class I SAM-dependent methyltransferase [Pseudomonas sp. GD03842]RAU43673.1 class I SAM-dependent methyltransferase [Pseudomonas sp. RIT 409]RAU54395.1 class I SAM-dependent methyltransferase [Pseudomonas sp. RIT 412]
MTESSAAGAAVYSPLTLALYDAWVLGVSNRFAWRCGTQSVLLPFFRANVRPRHLDIGVGTGYYLAKAQLSSQTQVTLLDLNPSSLEAAKRRINRPGTRTIQHDVFKPIPGGERFDSISLFYLLHCLPGPLEAKSAVFAHLKHNLQPGGVLFGATILGDSAGHNGFGRKLMAVYNKKGIFGNREDTEAGFETQLREHFSDVTLRREGCVLLFRAAQPIGI